MAPRVLTVGETMALLDPIDGDTFKLRIGGAESNVAIALTRLGIPTTWVSRLGTDPFGDLVAGTLTEEGIELRHVRRDSDRPTGVYFKSRRDGSTSVQYYRAGSAASVLSPADVPDEALEGIELVHLTGITVALGAGPRALVADLARRARARGITVVFDPNYRPALWPGGAAEAADAIRPILPSVDWFLAGIGECGELFGGRSPGELIQAVVGAGAGGAVVRVGERGAVLADGPELIEVPPARLEQVVDEVGAGDGFAAGFAYGLLQGWEPRRCAALGNLVAATALRGGGDWETYPRLAEIRAAMPLD